MSTLHRIRVMAIVSFLAIGTFELGFALSVPGIQGLIAPAQAVVGRPLTPVSVAGVARRTTRRCAADVYDC